MLALQQQQQQQQLQHMHLTHHQSQYIKETSEKQQNDQLLDNNHKNKNSSINGVSNESKEKTKKTSETATATVKKKRSKKKKMEHLGVTTKSERIKTLGLSCVDELSWSKWEPGGEYTKQLVFQNVFICSQKVKYRLPRTRYFSMQYPETATMSAGTSFSVPVTFRPVEKRQHEDDIEIFTGLGSFTVPLRALLPQHAVGFPDKLSLGTVPVGEVAESYFVLVNTGELQTRFEWSFPKPFKLSPMAGLLEVGESITVTISFEPSEATVLEALGVCRFDSLNATELTHYRTIVVHAIVKYSFLHVGLRKAASLSTFPMKQSASFDSPLVLDFGTVNMDTATERSFMLHNPTNVRASYSINKTDPLLSKYTGEFSDIDIFSVSRSAGVVLPGSTVVVPVTFTPVSIGCTNTSRLSIKTSTGALTYIQCVATTVGPVVEISCRSINFNDVPSGDTVQHTLTLTNRGSMAAPFEFTIDQSSVFHIDCLTGVLPAYTARTFIIRFSAIEPINYHRRVYCLVHHHQPLCIDLMATCFSDRNRPFCFKPKHIERHTRILWNGLGLYPPNQIAEMLNDGRAVDSDETGIRLASSVDVAEPVVSKAMGRFFDDGHLPGIPAPELVTISDPQVDFGTCSTLRLVESKVVRLTNNTRGKMTFVWMAGGNNSAFSVTPAQVDVRAGETYLFRIAFRPAEENQFFSNELECFAFFKSVRNFRLVQEQTFTPPVCVVVHASGHTVTQEENSFLPKLSFDSERVILPAVHIGDTAYRTIVIGNDGDTPIRFSFTHDQSNTFQIRPTRGIVLASGSRIVVLRFTPRKPHVYEHIMRCMVNDSPSNTYDLYLSGSGHVPGITIDIDAQGPLVFQPTCVGASSRRMYSVKNTSQIPVNFSWQIPTAHSNLLSVEPHDGILLPYEIQHHSWNFAPNVERKFIAQVACLVSRTNVSENLLVQQDPRFSPKVGREEPLPCRGDTVTILGEGRRGYITIEPAELTFGTVPMGGHLTKEITLYNPGACPLHFSLHLDGMTMDRDDSLNKVVWNNHKKRPIVSLQPNTGTLPARSFCIVQATMRPIQRVDYEFSLFCDLTLDGTVQRVATFTEQAETSESHDFDNKKLDEFAPTTVTKIGDNRMWLCEVHGTGVYPILGITDARSVTQSKGQLWKLFSLTHLNQELNADVSTAELEYNSLAGQNDRYRSCGSVLRTFDFNFGSGTMGSDASVTFLQLTNKGVAPLHFSFIFPNDLDIDVARWALMDRDEEEFKEQNLIIHSELFTIEPKSRSLNVGESVTVRVSYKHKYVSSHSLLVRLCVKEGKQVLLNLKGSTLAIDRRYLYFTNMHHYFESMPIGDVCPPVQLYELKNGGAVPLDFEFDLSTLEKQRKENYGFDIFECHRPVGHLDPGETAVVPWLFRPLEACTYEVTIPIRIIDGDTTDVKFSGVGYNDNGALRMNKESLLFGNIEPRIDRSLMECVLDIPIAPSIHLPGQALCLNIERLTLGDIPLYTSVRRMIVVSNSSPTDTLSFCWDLGHPLAHETLSVYPQHAQLAPGENTLCKIMFSSSGSPHLYDFDIFCEVVNDTAVAAFHAQTAAAKTASAERRSAIVITDSSSRLKSTDTVSESGEHRLDLRRSKYVALPDIKKIKKTRVNCKDEQEDDNDNDEDISIVAPSPTKIFLGIFARTHPINIYKCKFNDYNIHWIDRKVLSIQETEEERLAIQKCKSSAAVQSLNDVDREITESVVKLLLLDLMDDTDFQKAVLRIPSIPMPYYAQYLPRNQVCSFMLHDTGSPGCCIRTATPPEADEGTTNSTRKDALAVGNAILNDVRPDTKEDDYINECHKNVRFRDESSNSTLSIFDNAKIEEEIVPENINTINNSSNDDDEYFLLEKIRRLPEFENFVEYVLESTLFNILGEANFGDFLLTSKPLRVIAASAQPQDARSN